MEIRVLRYFLIVAQEGNITRAAETLHITQPTLSRQIAQLEEEVGAMLFDRSNRRLTLTSEGLLLRRRAEEILELVGKTEQEIAARTELVEGTVSLGCGDLAAVKALSELIRGFHTCYPAVDFELYTATADHIKERMDHGLTDLGLLLEPIDKDRYDYLHLPKPEEWVVAMPPDSPLSEREAITPADLRGLPLILPSRTNVQNELAHWSGDVFEKLNILFTSNLPSNSCVMVHSGLAFALLVRGSIDFWDPKIITCRPLSPPLQTPCILAWRRRQPFGPAAEKFIAYLREHLTEYNA